MEEKGAGGLFFIFFLLLDGVLPLQIPFTVVELVEGLFPYLVQLKTRVFITQPRKFRLTHYLKSEKNGVYWAKRKKEGGTETLSKATACASCPWASCLAN